MLALAVLATTGALAINRWALGGVPHVADEVSYLFQAKVFALGELALAPEPRALFGLENILLDDLRWVSIYPPGWPALLALGTLAGTPTVVSPLLLGVAVVGLWALGRSLFSATTGLLAALLLGTSPFALAMGASSMSHVPVLAVTTWCFWCLSMAAGRSRWWWCFAGLLGAYAGAIRPLTALLLLPIPMLWALARERHRQESAERRISPLAGALAALAVGAALPVAATMTYHLLVFGNPLELGYHLYDPSLRWTGRKGQYAPVLAIFAHHLPWYLGQLGTAVASLPGWAPVWLLPLLLKRSGRSGDAMLAATAAALVIGQSCYFWADHVYGGPRLVFESLGPLCLLLARSVGWLAETASERLRLWSTRPAVFWTGRLGRVLAGVLGAAVLLWTLGHRLAPELDRLRSWYHGTSNLPLETLEAHQVGDSALILVAAPSSVLGSLLVTGDLPPSSSGRVFARDIPAQREAIAAHFAREETWLLEVELEPVPGPNVYPDTARLKRILLTPMPAQRPVRTRQTTHGPPTTADQPERSPLSKLVTKIGIP